MQRSGRSILPRLAAAAASLTIACAAIGQIQPQLLCFDFPGDERMCCSFESLDEERVCSFPQPGGGQFHLFCGDEIISDGIFPEYRRTSSGWASLVTDSSQCIFIAKQCVTETESCDEVCPVACQSTCTGKIPNLLGDTCGSGVQ
jgi:hypothetical protein